MATRIAVCNHFPEMLNRFQQFLESHGFTVATFLQELGSLPHLNDFTPDVMILGHVRGYPSNYPQFIREVRANPETQTLPILVCTTGEVELVGEEGEEKVQYVMIGADALNLEHVLVAIRLILETDHEMD